MISKFKRIPNFFGALLILSLLTTTLQGQDLLNLKGGQIAVIDADNKMGTAHLTAQTMNLENVNSTDKATQDGFSVGVNANTSPKPANALQNQNAKTAQNNLPDIGSGTIGISQSGHDKEGYTQNLVGAGIAAGTTTGTGTQTQDLTQTNITTKDETRHEINANINSAVVTDLVHLATTTNSMAVLTDKSGYVGSKLNDIAGIGQIGLATNRVEDAAKYLGQSVAEGGGDLSKTLDKYNNHTAKAEATSQMTPAELDVMANPQNHSVAEKEAVATKYNAAYSDVRGIAASDQNMFDASKLDPSKVVDEKGLHKTDVIAATNGDPTKKEMFFENAKTNQGNNFAQALGTESERTDQIQKGIVNNTPDGLSTPYDQQARAAGSEQVADMTREMGYKGVVKSSDPNLIHMTTAQDTALMGAGTQKFDEVGNVQPDVILKDRNKQVRIAAPGTDIMIDMTRVGNKLDKIPQPALDATLITIAAIGTVGLIPEYAAVGTGALIVGGGVAVVSEAKTGVDWLRDRISTKTLMINTVSNATAFIKEPKLNFGATAAGTVISNTAAQLNKKDTK